MSNGNTAIPVSPVNDMVAALNAALASHARVPQLELDKKNLNTWLDDAQQHNQRLELNIIDYKNEIANLTSKVRSLEVERDDAGFHALEAEDKLAKLLGFMRNASTAMDDEIRFIDPPKPVPVVAETAKADEVKGSSDPSPTSPAADSSQALAHSQNATEQVTADTSYQPFTPPAPSAKPVEIMEERDHSQDWKGDYPWRT